MGYDIKLQELLHISFISHKIYEQKKEYNPKPYDYTGIIGHLGFKEACLVLHFANYQEWKKETQLDISATFVLTRPIPEVSITVIKYICDTGQSIYPTN